jgi:hypothetical protein
MPTYHEHCCKPGPNSLSYVPPPEARLFKSRSAPGSPLFDRNQHFSRSAKGSASFREPRHTRASFLLRESQTKKAEKYKNEKGIKLGRSKSFTSRITSKLYSRSKWNCNRHKTAFILHYVLATDHQSVFSGPSIRVSASSSVLVTFPVWRVIAHAGRKTHARTFLFAWAISKF